MGTKYKTLNDASPSDWDRATKKSTNEHGTIWKQTIKQAAIEEANQYNIPPFKLPVDAQARKNIPVYSGFFAYFPRAIAAVAQLSLVGGIQHGQTRETLHWDRPLSGDELDAMMRHMIDGDWEQVAWRAMAHLEKQLEKEEINDN
tara:strand:- start:2055 stop:2489 length:435 start_codon:yes stop_codon:yes gene_type:complete